MDYKEIKSFDELLKEIKKYITDTNELKIITDAYEFANEVHKNSKRLSGEDYILHPLNVAYILTTLNADSDTLATALMHDVITHGNASLENIKNKFNEDIVNLLDGLTTINKLSLSAESENLINYYKKIIIGLTEDVRIIILKLAERLHNMRTLWAIPEEKRKEKAKETLEILAPIAHRLGLSEIKAELEVLSLKYYKPEAYKSVEMLFDNTEEEREALIIKIKKMIMDELDKNKIEYNIKARVKSIYSVYNKLQKGKEIFDLYALRIIVDSISDCYQVLGIIHSMFKPYPKRFKDYIANPKNNMYQSLHTTVFGPEDKYYEIQIRTKDMDEVAERGIASHWSYKEQGKKIQISMEQKLQIFRNIMNLKNENLSDKEFVSEAKEQILGDSIYIYSPKGDVYELPVGSTPIDFAYRIHTNIGETMVGAIVNDNMVPLDTELKSGDVVNIKTNKNSTPSLEWMSIVKTSHARNKIKTYFSKIDKEEAKSKGKELLLKELRRKKISIDELKEKINNVYNELKIDNENDMFLTIGSGTYTPISIINIAFKEEQSKEDILLEKISNKEITTKSNSKNDILVNGLSEVKISLANCCKPIPGDEIVGYISKGNGIIVHHKNCKNVRGIDRLINVEWNKDLTRKFNVKLLLITELNDNVLYDIITTTSSNNLSILSINDKKKNYENFVDLIVEVQNEEELKKYILILEQLSFVKSVTRIFE